MSRGWCDCTGGDRDTVGLRAADYSEIGPSVRLRILLSLNENRIMGNRKPTAIECVLIVLV